LIRRPFHADMQALVSGPWIRQHRNVLISWAVSLATDTPFHPIIDTP
jgi:hypothetical protein